MNHKRQPPWKTHDGPFSNPDFPGKKVFIRSNFSQNKGLLRVVRQSVPERDKELKELTRVIGLCPKCHAKLRTDSQALVIQCPFQECNAIIHPRAQMKTTCISEKCEEILLHPFTASIIQCTKCGVIMDLTGVTVSKIQMPSVPKVIHVD
ncbi:MAG: hypothetical protein GY714_14145 [Desulfobacterales bacterium]|nr:hypothetical protein [Desulfobacterales bacterium]